MKATGALSLNRDSGHLSGGEIMLPIGPLMIEHRLIERMIQAAKIRLEGIRTEKKLDHGFLARIVHFFTAYADRCHHGKEEDILFRALLQKNISPEDQRILEELVEEHTAGRRMVMSLGEDHHRYQSGEIEARSEIVDSLNRLVEFYPKHIEKEDKHFFLPVMNYFSDEEKDDMIRRGYALDSRLLHQEFEDLVKAE
jgi:hemerythrin-like domain-containing protein